MNGYYDGVSKEELIAENEKLKVELLMARSERKHVEEENRKIKAERPGYKWRWSDERYIALSKRNQELEAEIEEIRNRQECIRTELEFIKKANNGGCERSCNYYDEYDADLYLKELVKNGCIFAIRF